MTTLSTGQLSKIFVEAADTLTAEFHLPDFLHMITVRTAGLVGAAAVGMLLADEHDELQFMAASQDNAKWLELFQLQSREGPCLEAFRSVHAFPLRVRREVIGALNVFGTTVGTDFDDADVPIVQALADVAAIGLLQQRVLLREQTLTDQLQRALESRVLIEQAKGVIIRAYGVSPDEAFTLLRGYSRRRNERIADLAGAIVTDPANLPDLTSPHPDPSGLSHVRDSVSAEDSLEVREGQEIHRKLRFSAQHPSWARRDISAAHGIYSWHRTKAAPGSAGTLHRRP